MVNRTLGALIRAIISQNIKSWDEYLPFVEFAYNRVIHSTSRCSPFKVVYRFNPLTPLYFLPIPSNIFVSEAATTTSKENLIKTLHKEVKERI